MQVTVNQQAKRITNEQVQLSTFLATLEVATQQIAVAINDQIIPKSIWPTTQLKEGDDIAIFSMIAGG